MIAAIIVIILICFVIAFILKITEDFFIAAGPFFVFLADNFFFIAGIICCILGFLVFTYFKPHPAEKHFISYKKGQITRQQAIEKIAATMYNPRRHGLPPAYKTKIITKRTQALRRRVKVEADLFDELIRYMKLKSIIE